MHSGFPHWSSPFLQYETQNRRLTDFCNLVWPHHFCDPNRSTSSTSNFLDLPHLTVPLGTPRPNGMDVAAQINIELSKCTLYSALSFLGLYLLSVGGFLYCNIPHRGDWNVSNSPLCFIYRSWQENLPTRALVSLRYLKKLRRSIHWCIGKLAALMR